MVTLTVSITNDLKAKMDQFPEMNWSAITRSAIQKQIEMMEKFRAFTKDSELTEADAITLGKNVSSTASERLRKLKKHEGRR